MPQNRQNLPPRGERSRQTRQQEPAQHGGNAARPPLQGQPGRMQMTPQDRKSPPQMRRDMERRRPAPQTTPVKPPAVHGERKKTAQKRGAGEQKRRGNGVWKFRLSVFLVCFILLSAITVAIFFSMLYQQDKPTDDYTLIFGEEKITAPGDLVFHDGQYFVNFSRVARMLNMTAVGAPDAVRFVLQTDGGYTDMRVWAGESSVMINDRNILLGTAVVIQGGEVWLPAVFLTEQMSGVYYHIDAAKRMLAISLTPFDEKGKPLAHSEGKAAFKVIASVPLSPVETAEPLDTTAPEDSSDTTADTQAP